MQGDDRDRDGPSTLTYLETRLNLLTAAIEKMEITIDRRFVSSELAASLATKGVDERFRHTEEIARIIREASQTAVNKAEAAQSAHNLAANEWRGTLNDFKTTLVSRAEFDKLYGDFQAYRMEVSRLLSVQAGIKEGTREIRVDTREAQQVSTAQMTLIVAAVSAVVTILVSVALAFFRGTGHA